MIKLLEKIKNLPKNPGVYIMKNSSGKVIYVGKAKNLKNRVTQYFRSDTNHSDKVKSMVLNIRDFEYIITDTEAEALILECNLIKKYRPKYNILLKDDKTYPYIKITLNEEYPRIFLTRTVLNDKARYFGPYLSSQIVNDNILVVKKLFKVRSCKKNLPKEIDKERPCLYYHIGRCLAPCQSSVSKEEYRSIFEGVCEFLEGKEDNIIKRLTKEMERYSNNLEFEKAAEIRDKIHAAKKLSEKQKIVLESKTDKDIIAFARENDITFSEVFMVRKGKLMGAEHFLIDNTFSEEDSFVAEEFVKQYYNERTFVPKEIACEYEVDQEVENMLSKKSGHKVSITLPKRGETKKLLLMAKKNAINELKLYKENKLKDSNFGDKVLKELKELLNLSDIPKRIEAYDISNTQGSESVGSMVVFTNAKPDKKEYRKFKIKSVEGPNDYESVKEVLYRRFTHSHRSDDKKFEKFPDVLLIDGGKGHVFSAKEVLKELGIQIPVFGMVKNDKHRTRGLVSEEGEIQLQIFGSAFNFITKVQDEVHRSAITYHKSLRDKKNIRSELQNIEGVGEKRALILLKEFKSIKKIKEQSVEALKSVKGIDEKCAQSIYNYFHF